MVGALLTNFHLPQSTLLMLVCAFGEKNRWRPTATPWPRNIVSIRMGIACSWSDGRQPREIYTGPLRGRTWVHRHCLKPVPIEDFVANCANFPEPAFGRTEQILHFLEHTPVAPETLERYLTWDRQHYTRNLIDKTPLYELIAICWDIGQVSSVHNHRDQNCWMAVPIGRLQVENYRVLAQELEKGTPVWRLRTRLR